MKPVWEQVGEGLRRLPVPNGWIVQASERGAEGWRMVSVFFVPDLPHAWSIT